MHENSKIDISQTFVRIQYILLCISVYYACMYHYLYLDLLEAKNLIFYFKYITDVEILIKYNITIFPKQHCD